MTTNVTTPQQHPSHRRRPPVDHRFLGLDTRAFPYALGILAVWLLWVVVVPAIDSAVSSENPTVAGDRIAVTPTLSFVAPEGWNIGSGFRVGERGVTDTFPAVTLTNSSVSFSVSSDSFDGTADELLTQIDAVAAGENGTSFLAVSSAPQPVTAEGGLAGVQVRFSTPRATGSVTSFVQDGNGVEIQVVGPPDQVAGLSSEIDAMIASLGNEGVNR